MIPILYEQNETAFTSNGLGRLRDCVSCVVSEGRNDIYEIDFEYPVNGVNYDRIKCGRIVAVTHDESGDVQPFDIISYSRPIDGIVTFHGVHISYRMTAITVDGSNINSLSEAFTMLETTEPDNPFTFWTDKNSSGYMAAADKIPHSVRQILGGMEGSILDTYGGEYEFDKWTVKLWQNRGSVKPFTLRYGLNLTEYNEELDYSDTYTAVIPYWFGQNSKGSDIVVKGNKVTADYPPFNGFERCIPLDLSDKFEDKPTAAQLETEAASYLSTNQTYLPAQTIEIDFVRITDGNEYGQFEGLQKCRLCDIVTVVYPAYQMQGQFKIVKTEYDVLMDRYQKIELGTLATSLSEALGISYDSVTNMRTISGEVASVMERTGTGTKTLTTTSTVLELTTTSLSNGQVFSANGNGIKCNAAGIIHVVASVRFTTGFTANDYIDATVYNGSTAVKTSRIRTPFAVYGGDVLVSVYTAVNEGDTIYLRVRNETGGRGTVDRSITRLTACYVGEL